MNPMAKPDLLRDWWERQEKISGERVAKQDMEEYVKGVVHVGRSSCVPCVTVTAMDSTQRRLVCSLHVMRTTRPI